MVLGGVAPYPYRALAAEERVMGAGVADVDVVAAEAGKLAVVGATPLRGNAYKVDLAANLVKLALVRVLSGDEDQWADG